MAHSLPALPYDVAALEPHIDSQTMQIHHGKHHQAYVTNLNAALDKHPELHNKSLDDLIKGINGVPDDIKAAVRNNGGGHWNHSLFWTLMEGRAAFEFGSFYSLRLLMRRLPKGDGHPVLVLPGFVASDVSTRPLRAVLKDLGYASYGWGLGRNLKFNDERERAMSYPRVTDFIVKPLEDETLPQLTRVRTIL